MGIKGLLELIKKEVPGAIGSVTMEELAGRGVAVDASIVIYQLMGVFSNGGGQILNKRGEQINHIQGVFFRTLQMIEKGITPTYVFDNAPPEVKAAALEKRKAVRKIRISGAYFDDVRELLGYMGVDVVEAKSEADSTCAQLAAKGKFGITAVGSEDIDVLAFGAPILIKKLAVGVGKKKDHKMKTVTLKSVLEGLGITMAQFIDLCILCGCDYTVTIPGIGPKKALELVKKYTTIEEILKAIKKQELAFEVPDEFDHKAARKEFARPKATLSITKKGRYNHGDLRDFLVSKGMDLTRVNNGLERMKTAVEKRIAAAKPDILKVEAKQ